MDLVRGGKPVTVRPIAAILAAVAVAFGASACGNQNPNVTVAQQPQPSATEPSGREVSPAAATATVSAQTATLGVIEHTQVQLQRMYTATHNLATPDGVGVHQAQSELKDVARQLDSLAHRAQMLPRSDPARPLLVSADEALSKAAGALGHLGLGSTNQSRILAMTDPITHVRVDIGRIGRRVTSTDRANIHADLQDLSTKVAQLERSPKG